MTTLRTMTAAAFPGFIGQAVKVYAAENIAAGRWGGADALELSRADHAKLLPEGVATAGHFLFEIAADGSGEAVGHLWLASMPRGSSRIAFVYQVFIEPGHRRRGHARGALLAAERFAVTQGLSGIALHVFAHNAEAQALYRSLGYEVASFNMLKPLAG